MAGTLLIVATPIGNLQDISLRAARTLLTAKVIACEDTRHTGILLKEIVKLFSNYEETQKPQLISFYDEVESQRFPQILNILEQGTDVVLVSDAGTPGISDPGFKLIRACIEKGIRVESIPGPSAPITALVVSGLPTDKFFFLGYPPKKEGHRKEFWTKLQEVRNILKTTYILFEAPHRVRGTLEEMISIYGEDQYVILARELTKTYEEVLRGNLQEMRNHFKNTEPRGEFVILFTLS